ncbi:hypothetical protein FACS1894103_1830 [Campylobacterota bacterium]|nr:hypothetical protein FACS1894103_1830 [Campylobacterota bacterium]
MVKRLFAGAVWAVVTLMLIIAFLPKKELYYFAEQLLLDYRINVNNETAVDYALALRLKNADLVYDRMPIAKIDNMSLLTTFFYNRFEVMPFVFSNELAALMPARIDRLEAVHTIFMPHLVFVSGAGQFGEFEGKIDLISRIFTVTLTAPQEIVDQYAQVFQMMTKLESGGYAYELNF